MLTKNVTVLHMSTEIPTRRSNDVEIKKTSLKAYKQLIRSAGKSILELLGGIIRWNNHDGVFSCL